MKTKNLLIGCVAALALLLGTGAGTASAQTPGGTDSQNASDFSVALFQVANEAFTEAANSGDQAEAVLAFDILVVSYLCNVIVEGYNDQSFFLSEFLSNGAFTDTTADAETGFELALTVGAFSANLAGTGNTNAGTLSFLATSIQSFLQSAIENND